jgi:hypothetical protein
MRRSSFGERHSRALSRSPTLDGDGALTAFSLAALAHSRVDHTTHIHIHIKLYYRSSNTAPP